MKPCSKICQNTQNTITCNYASAINHHYSMFDQNGWPISQISGEAKYAETQDHWVRQNQIKPAPPAAVPCFVEAPNSLWQGLNETSWSWSSSTDGLVSCVRGGLGGKMRVTWVANITQCWLTVQTVGRLVRLVYMLFWRVVVLILALKIIGTLSFLYLLFCNSHNIYRMAPFN